MVPRPERMVGLPVLYLVGSKLDLFVREKPGGLLWSESGIQAVFPFPGGIWDSRSREQLGERNQFIRSKNQSVEVY
jgi:hypothetical protein